MGKEIFLGEEYDFDFSLIGLISYLRPYKLAYFLNKTLHLRLTQDPIGLDYFDKATNQHLFFPFFKWENHERQAKYILVKNKVELLQEASSNENELLQVHKTRPYLLIPEQKRFHYFLVVKDTFTQEQDLTQKLNHLTFIHHTTTIDVYSLKSRHNLIL